MSSDKSQLLGVLSKLPLAIEVNPQREIAKQEQSRNNLLNRASRAVGAEKFLAVYDASMRSLEIILLLHSLRLRDMPHRVLKEVVKFLSPNFDIDELVAKRHQIKKNQQNVNQKDLDQAAALELLLSDSVLKIRSQLCD